MKILISYFAKNSLFLYIAVVLVLNNFMQVCTEFSGSLGLLMMARNEQWNIQANLPLWVKTGIFDYYVLGIDRRTNDQTFEVIQRILSDAPNKHIFFFDFDGFGAARNILLLRAQEMFPKMTHGFMIDPDWKPEIGTISADELDFFHTVYSFQLYDKSQTAIRHLDWLFQIKPFVKFKYNLHEQLTVPSEWKRVKTTNWVLHEIPASVSWHTDEHEDYKSMERFFFDQRMLEKDFEEDPDDPRNWYYLGVINLAIVDKSAASENTNLDIEEHKRKGIYYLEKSLSANEPNSTHSLSSGFTWLALRFLGNAYWQYQNNPEAAKITYQRCIEMAPEIPDCYSSLSQILFAEGKLAEAWAASEGALKTRPEMLPARNFLHHFYNDCMVPLIAAKTLAHLALREFPETWVQEEPPWVQLGSALVVAAQHKCDPNQKLIHESTEVLPALERIYTQLQETKGISGACVPLNKFTAPLNVKQWNIPRCNPNIEEYVFEDIEGVAFGNFADDLQSTSLSVTKVMINRIMAERANPEKNYSQLYSSLWDHFGKLSCHFLGSRVEEDNFKKCPKPKSVPPQKLVVDLEQYEYLLKRDIFPELLSCVIIPEYKEIIANTMQLNESKIDILYAKSIYISPSPKFAGLDFPKDFTIYQLQNSWTKDGYLIFPDLLSIQNSMELREMLLESVFWHSIFEGDTSGICALASLASGLFQRIIFELLDELYTSFWSILYQYDVSNIQAVRYNNPKQNCETTLFSDQQSPALLITLWIPSPIGNSQAIIAQNVASSAKNGVSANKVFFNNSLITIHQTNNILSLDDKGPPRTLIQNQYEHSYLTVLYELHKKM